MTTIRFNEIIEEIVEDLELQAGLVLSSDQVMDLKMTYHLSFNSKEFFPYIPAIKTYLRETPAECRVWDCLWSLGSSTYMIVIQLPIP